MEPGIDRDAGLQEISEKVVSRDLTTNPTMIPRGGPDVRAAMNGRLRHLLQLADRATGPDLRARLLVRTAVVKRSFNKENHVATAPDEADLDPDALLVKVDGLAKQVPPRREGSGWGVGLKILLTTLLGMLGFAVSQVFEPVLKASGASSPPTWPAAPPLGQPRRPARPIQPRGRRRAPAQAGAQSGLVTGGTVAYSVMALNASVQKSAAATHWYWWLRSTCARKPWAISHWWASHQVPPAAKLNALRRGKRDATATCRLDAALFSTLLEDAGDESAYLTDTALVA